METNMMYGITRNRGTKEIRYLYLPDQLADLLPEYNEYFGSEGFDGFVSDIRAGRAVTREGGFKADDTFEIKALTSFAEIFDFAAGVGAAGDLDDPTLADLADWYSELSESCLFTGQQNKTVEDFLTEVGPNVEQMVPDYRYQELISLGLPKEAHTDDHLKELRFSEIESILANSSLDTWKNEETLIQVIKRVMTGANEPVIIYNLQGELLGVPSAEDLLDDAEYKTSFDKEMRYCKCISYDAFFDDLWVFHIDEKKEEKASEAALCDKIRQIKRELALAGYSTTLTRSSLIDANHLFCIWYGGEIGSVSNDRYDFRVCVYGDVRISGIVNDSDVDYTNKSNTGAVGCDIIRQLTDKTYDLALQKGYLDLRNNNWIEIEAYRRGSRELLWSEVEESTDNLLEAFAGPDSWDVLVQYTDKLLESSNK